MNRDWCMSCHVFFFQAEVLGVEPTKVDVPMVGGHDGVTILPHLSQVLDHCREDKLNG